MAAQIVFYSWIVAPAAAFLVARMVTYGILMSRKRFAERYRHAEQDQNPSDNTNQKESE